MRCTRPAISRENSLPILKTLRVGDGGRAPYGYSVEKEHFRIADDGVTQDRVCGGKTAPSRSRLGNGRGPVSRTVADGLEPVHFVEQFDAEEAVGRLLEHAQEVLVVFDFVGSLLHFEEGRVDVRAVRYRREDSVPAGVVAVPDVVEKASGAARGGH